ncbi:parF (plasmid) [Salmonella enterica subsp. enterica serovar Heidelberg str. B182]|nr:parF [Salmonella enterica subsp. enterica serovar Heidelberg str. B182]
MLFTRINSANPATERAIDLIITAFGQHLDSPLNPESELDVYESACNKGGVLTLAGLKPFNRKHR